MVKSIISIGFDIPGYDDQCLRLDSDQSLLDYDIIIFTPQISGTFSYSQTQFKGKPWLDESNSFNLKEKSERWRQELTSAFDHGKTIIIFLPPYEEVYVATGDHSYSGSGRNRVTTTHVEAFYNYGMIPLSFDELTSAHGREIKPSKDLGLLTTYWKEFGAISEYQVYFDSASLFPSASLLPLLETKAGKRTVGGLVREKPDSGKGTFVLLPKLEYDEEQFQTERKDGLYWNKKGLEFGAKLISAVVEIDKALNSEKQKTPTPDWVKNKEFRIQNESVLERKVEKLTSQIELLQDQKRTTLAELDNEGSSRRLLFETGPALEDAILDALGALGLKADRYKDAESEFDAVFTWSSHRFLGEAEGKDSKAINVDKISQLERNINEDYERDEVTDRAKGILFGNAFRLQKLSERGDFFTEKCITSAKRLGIALVRTPDLFFIARYVKESGDKEFSQKCIEAILAAEGIVVVFPPSQHRKARSR